MYKRQLQAKLMHFQQGGFEFARPGDKNWFIIAPLINRQNENKIVDYRRLDDYTTVSYTHLDVYKRQLLYCST